MKKLFGNLAAQKNLRASLFFIVLVFALPVFGAENTALDVVRSGSIVDRVGGKYLGEMREEMVADSPSRTGERSLRMSLSNHQDPTLETRLSAGRWGFELRGSIMRKINERGIGTFSLLQDDIDGDGIFETANTVYKQQEAGGQNIAHRQSVFSAISVTSEQSTFALLGLFENARTRGQPTEHLLAWPLPVTPASGFAAEQTVFTDLATGTELLSNSKGDQATLSRDQDFWWLGLRYAYRGPFMLRMAAGFGIEKNEMFGTTTAEVVQDVQGGIDSSEISERLNLEEKSSRIIGILETYIPAKIGTGARITLDLSRRMGAWTSRRRGAIKERLNGVAVGAVQVSRDRVYEWVDEEIEPMARTEWSGEVWLRAMPFSSRQVGEFLFGYRFDQQKMSTSVRETLEATVRDSVDNGNGIEDAGDLFKRGSGSTVFQRVQDSDQHSHTIWTRIGGTFGDDSNYFLLPSIGFHTDTKRMVRTMVSQKVVEGTTQSVVGTVDPFQEPAAFSQLPVLFDERSQYVSATFDTVIDWKPIESLSVISHLQFDPLAGAQGRSNDIFGGWISQFGAEAVYSFR